MKKPAAIKWINGLNYFRLIIVVIFVTITIIVLNTKPDEGVLTGAAEAILDTIEVEKPFDNPGYTTGFLLGKFFFLLIPAILELFFINKRKRIAFWITFGFDVLIVIANLGFPLVQIVIFILALQGSSKNYFKGLQQMNRDNTLLDTEM